jgi:hypothetical protein
MTTNPYPVDSTLHACCGGIGGHAASCLTPDVDLPPHALDVGPFDTEDGTRSLVAYIGPNKEVSAWARQYGNGDLDPTEVYVMLDQNQSENGYTAAQSRDLAVLLDTDEDTDLHPTREPGQPRGGGA